ncbi:MAG: hypothetical protein QW343_02040 [Candidatus Norongarragalinales archaeon]
MVAVAEVIKRMRAEGMTREQIIDTLAELGFPNAAELYDKNAGAQQAPKPPTPKPFGLAEAAAREEKEEDAEKKVGGKEGDKEEKPLFEEVKKTEKEGRSEVSSEPRELQITQVSDEGLEKTVSIEDLLSKEGVAATAPERGAEATRETVDSSLRAKLEETNALLRALAEVNKKILETDREVLMRLKAKEAKPI